MKKAVLFLIMLTSVLWMAGCNNSLGANDPLLSGDDSADIGDDDGDGISSEVLGANDAIVKLTWGRSEVVRMEGLIAYCSIYGECKTELTTNKSQTVKIHYSSDGINWSNFNVKSSNKTDDRKYRQFFYCTPLVALDTAINSHPLLYLKVEYVKNGVSYFSEYGRAYQTCPMPDTNLPSGVVGQAIPTGKHFLFECAKATPIVNTNGELTGYRLHGHFQVKNETLNDTGKYIKIIYKTNTMEWNRPDERTFPKFYAVKTTNTFYPNGYNRTMENWEFNLILPSTTTSIQFISFYKSNGSNTSSWSDRNRCRKYHIDPFPGIVLTYATN